MLTRSSLKAKIIKVDSLTIFWVQFQNSNENLLELIEEFTRRMIRRMRFLPLLSNHRYINEAVAIKEGRKWHRGILTQIRGDGTARGRFKGLEPYHRETLL